MAVTDAQVKKLRAEMTKTGKVGVSAMRAGMHRNTATKFLAADELPSELKKPRRWRIRCRQPRSVGPKSASTVTLLQPDESVSDRSSATILLPSIWFS